MSDEPIVELNETEALAKAFDAVAALAVKLRVPAELGMRVDIDIGKWEKGTIIGAGDIKIIVHLDSGPTVACDPTVGIGYFVNGKFEYRED